MTTVRSIKINFQDDSRDVDLPYPATLTGLQVAVASTFEVELPVRASSTAADGDLSFTYRDPDGDDIMFDRDSELSLALRLCPESLEISAAAVAVEPKEPSKPTVKVARLYHVAARNLREYKGVPSMTPAMLIKTLALFKLSPRRLVQQGLAPTKLLKELKNASNVAGASAGGSGDTAEHKEHHMPDGGDAESDWETVFADFAGDGNPGAFDVETATSSGEEQAPTSEEDTPSSPSSADEDSNSTAKKPLVGVKGVIHAALAAAEIQLKPREAKPLFRALDVHPIRLVRLGLVDGKELRIAHKLRARGGLERPTDFVPGPNDDWGKGGKPYGPIPRPSNAGGAPHGVFQYTPPPHWACTATSFAPPGTWCLIHPGGPPAAPDTYANWGGMMPPWVESGVHQREGPPSHHRGSVSGRHHGWSF